VFFKILFRKQNPPGLPAWEVSKLKPFTSLND